MPRRASSNQILASVLFTDIVGSTETASRLGDRDYKHLLAKHHSIMRKELKRFGGKEMDTAGDGFFIAFDQPADAIRCAVAVSERLRPLDVHIRAGVHMGQVEVDGPKVQGIAVNIGARVMAKAQGDEVLVSSTVRDALAGAEIRFDDRGSYELKGIDGEWHLFAVERSEALVARALGKEPVETPGDGGVPPRRGTASPRRWSSSPSSPSPRGDGVFLANRDGARSFTPAVNTVMSLDRTDAAVTGGAPVGDVPLAVAADDSNVWVANFGSGNVTKIDPSGESAPLPLSVTPPGNPTAVAVGGDEAWVAVGGSGGAVNRFSANASTPKSYPIEPGLAGIAYGEDSVWVTDDQNGNLYKLDPTTGSPPQRYHMSDVGGLGGVAVGAGSVWVASGLGEQALLRVDPETGTSEPISLPGDPQGVAFGEGSVWVTIPDLDLVQRIDPRPEHPSRSIRGSTSRPPSPSATARRGSPSRTAAPWSASTRPPTRRALTSRSPTASSPRAWPWGQPRCGSRSTRRSRPCSLGGSPGPCRPRKRPGRYGNAPGHH